MAREAPLLLALAALAGASLWLRGDDRPPAAEPAAAALPQPTAQPAAATPVAEAPAAPAAAPTDRSRQLELPDGSFVATLNGATNPAPIAKFWGTQVPWSPIVGVERNDRGVDWYRHENGSYSTTEMVWRSDLGRFDAMTRVAHPGPANTPTTVAAK